MALWAQPALAAPSEPKDPEARKHFDRAVALFKEEDFDGAAAEAEAGYEIEENELLLFIWAQSERLRHNCVEAVELYDAFIETTQDEAKKQKGLTSKALCAEELAEIARQVEAEAEAEAEDETEDDLGTTEPVTDDTPPSTTRPWYHDPVGGVLVGVGGVGVLGGASLLVAAAILDPAKASNYATFDARQILQPKLLIAGGITAGVGVAVGTAGAVRWILVARKNKREAAQASRPRLQASPWLDGQRAGVVFSGRF